MLQTMIVLENVWKVKVLHTVVRGNAQPAEFAGFAERTCLRNYAKLRVAAKLLETKRRRNRDERDYLKDRQTESPYVQLLETIRHPEEARIRDGDDGIVRQAQDLQFHQRVSYQRHCCQIVETQIEMAKGR